MAYIISLLTLIAIYVIAAISFHMLIEHAGIFSVAHAAFMGIGAYTTGILTLRMIGLFPVAFIIGASISFLIGWVFARSTLKVSGDYMVIASFALLVICDQLFTNLSNLTGGGIGLPGIPRPGFTSDFELNSGAAFLIFCIACASICYAFSYSILASPLGRALRGMKDEESALATLGHNVTRYKCYVFGVSSALASISGSLYAHYLSYISPLEFTVLLTVLILTMAVMTGKGAIWHVVVATAIVMGLTEGVRYINLPTSIAAGAQQMIYGALLLGFAIARPNGLFVNAKDY